MTGYNNAPGGNWRSPQGYGGGGSQGYSNSGGGGGYRS